MMGDIERSRMAEALRDEFGEWIASHPNAGLFDWQVAAENVLCAIDTRRANEKLRDLLQRAYHVCGSDNLAAEIENALGLVPSFPPRGQ